LVATPFNASIRWGFDREPALTRDTTVSSTPPAGFGRFRVVHQLGAGVLGPVFLGVDPAGDRQVAIKAFPLDITPERAATLAAALDRLVATPLGHPSLVALIAAGAEGSTAYLVQEYVLAESVDAAVREYGPAPVPDALRLVGQLAGALDFAAVAGVHHGALHPRDVLVAPHEVRLTGLGIAGAFEEVGLRVTPRRPYAAPERRERADWGTPADVFSLAAVGFELLTGRRPGSVEALAADARSIPSPDPSALAEVFARALSPRPGDRYQTALAFAAALRQALTGEPIERPEAAPPAVASAALVAAAGAAAAGEEGEGTDEAAEGEETEGADEVAAGEKTEGADEVAAGQEPAAGEEAAAQAEALSAVPPELEVFQSEPARDAVETRSLEFEAGQGGEVAAAVAPPQEDLAAGEPEIRNEPALEAPAALPDAPVEAPIDELRSAEEISPQVAVPEGPSELGGETEPAAMAAPLLPLEVEPERPSLPLEKRGAAEAWESPPIEKRSATEAWEPPPIEERTAEAWQVTPPPAPPFVPGHPVAPPGVPRREAVMMHRSRRSGFPLSSLLAMLLLGLAAGFAGGYLVGRGEPGAGGSPPATATQPASDAGSSEAPPTVVDRPELATPGAAGDRPAGNGAEAAPRDEARADEPPPPAVPRPAEAAPRAAASRPVRTPAQSAGGRDEPEGPFEAPLLVISRPEGALVRLDGRPVGKTPLRLTAIRAGAHVVRLELSGYLPWTAAIQVVSGAQNRVTASLERRPGGIE